MRSEPGGRSRLAIISALGVVEIFAWGSSFYLPAVLAGPVAQSTGWPLAGIVGGLTLGLLVAAFASPPVGVAIQRHGGRPVLALAAGLVTLAVAPVLPVYLAGWLLLGLGMACGLYDPAAALSKSGWRAWSLRVGINGSIRRCLSRRRTGGLE